MSTSLSWRTSDERVPISFASIRRGFPFGNHGDSSRGTTLFAAHGARLPFYTRDATRPRYRCGKRNARVNDPSQSCLYSRGFPHVVPNYSPTESLPLGPFVIQTGKVRRVRNVVFVHPRGEDILIRTTCRRHFNSDHRIVYEHLWPQEDPRECTAPPRDTDRVWYSRRAGSNKHREPYSFTGLRLSRRRAFSTFIRNGMKFIFRTPLMSVIIYLYFNTLIFTCSFTFVSTLFLSAFVSNSPFVSTLHFFH